MFVDLSELVQLGRNLSLRTRRKLWRIRQHKRHGRRQERKRRRRYVAL